MGDGKKVAFFKFPEYVDPHPHLTRFINARIKAELDHDRAIIETACEMSLLDPEQRGVRVDRATGEVYLSAEVPYGSLYEYLESEGRLGVIGPRLFLKDV